MSITGDEPVIDLNLRTNLFLGRREKAEEIVEVLLKHGSVFVPSTFDIGKRKPHKISFEENLDRVVEKLIDDEDPGLVAERRRPVKVDWVCNFSRSRMFDSMFILFAEEWFRVPKHVSILLEFTRNLYGTMEASSGYIRHSLFEPAYDRIVTNEPGHYHSKPRFPGVKNRLRGLYWANIFGPEYVAMWGEEFLIDAPCHKSEKLHDGGLILYLSESPLDAKDDRYQRRKNELFDYLGYEAFDGRRFPRFRTEGKWRKKRHARPLIETGGIRDDVFSDEEPPAHYSDS
jgi:hypothetical protein